MFKSSWNSIQCHGGDSNFSRGLLQVFISEIYIWQWMLQGQNISPCSSWSPCAVSGAGPGYFAFSASCHRCCTQNSSPPCAWSCVSLTHAYQSISCHIWDSPQLCPLPFQRQFHDQPDNRGETEIKQIILLWIFLVYLFVLPQIFVDFKWLITVFHITVEPLLLIMDHLMDPQGTTCGESFLAFFTLIGLLPCVYSLMIFQSSLHSECLSTCFTFKRFLMSMVPSDVNVEVELFLKNFITALMWTLPICTNVLRVHVPDTVLVQLCWRFKLLGTFLA